MLNLESLETRDVPSITFLKGVLEVDAPAGGCTVIANPTAVPGEVSLYVHTNLYTGTVLYNDVVMLGVKANVGGLCEFEDNTYLPDSFNGTLGTDNIYVGSFGEINGGCTGPGYNSFHTRDWGFSDIILQGGNGIIVSDGTITGNRTGYTITS